MGNRSANLVSIDNPNHMFISRHELMKLREVLSEIPGLAVDLAVTITKQARLGEVGRGRNPRRPSEQPLPYNIAAAKVADELHNALVGWARLTCEQRAMDYTGPSSTPGIARWLNRNVVALAMTEGSDAALEELGRLRDAAYKIVCPPAQQIVINESRHEAARRLRLNANGVATLARELGEEYRHLTRRRVFVLKDAGVVAPAPGPWRPGLMLFVVGEVLDAHLALPIRERHAEAC